MRSLEEKGFLYTILIQARRAEGLKSKRFELLAAHFEYLYTDNHCESLGITNPVKK